MWKRQDLGHTFTQNRGGDSLKKLAVYGNFQERKPEVSIMGHMCATNGHC